MLVCFCFVYVVASTQVMMMSELDFSRCCQETFCMVHCRPLPLIMVALWNRADYYIFVLWFLLSFFFFFSSPNLSRRRLDVCHTSTHGVALVRI